MGFIGYLWHTYCLSPRGRRASSIKSILTRDGSSIELYIYEPSPSDPSDPSNPSDPSDPSSHPPDPSSHPSSPPSHRTPHQSSSSDASSARQAPREESKEKGGKICVVNFHGGGWSIGHPTEDARWALYCTSSSSSSSSSASSSSSTPLGAIFISVGYRLAPEYPYPTPVLDCLDAVRWILENADELGVDKEKVVLSGFSAGGCLAITTALALANPHLENEPEIIRYALRPLRALQPGLPTTPTSSLSAHTDPAPSTATFTTSNTSSNINSNSNSNSDSKSTPSSPDIHTGGAALGALPSDDDDDGGGGGGGVKRVSLRGVISFYPLVDFHTPRSTKLLRSPNPRIMRPLPGWLTRLFDSSYLPSRIDRQYPLISPLLALPSLFRGLPHLHLILCEADVLAQEAQEFADRLRLVSPSPSSLSQSQHPRISSHPPRISPTSSSSSISSHPPTPPLPPGTATTTSLHDSETNNNSLRLRHAQASTQSALESDQKQKENRNQNQNQNQTTEPEREVITRWVKGARHAWDKPPHLVSQSVMDEYDAAVDSVRRWCA